MCRPAPKTHNLPEYRFDGIDHSSWWTLPHDFFLVLAAIRAWRDSDPTRADWEVLDGSYHNDLMPSILISHRDDNWTGIGWQIFVDTTDLDNYTSEFGTPDEEVARFGIVPIDADDPDYSAQTCATDLPALLATLDANWNAYRQICD